MQRKEEGRETSSVPETAIYNRKIKGKGFWNLFGSTTVAAFGGSVSTVAVSWIVYSYTHNAIFIAYLGIAGIVPGIVLGLLAGVIADRYDKKTLMVTSDVVRMISMAFLSIFFHFIGFSFPLILAIMLVVYTFSTFFLPASQAILPMLVNRESLENSNGMLQGSASVFQAVGSAAGGLIVYYLGAVWGLGINAMTYALSAIFLFQLIGHYGSGLSSISQRETSIAGELRIGMRYMKEHLPILEATIGALPANFFGSLFSPFIVVYASDKFGSNSAAYGYLVAAIGTGMAIGAIMVGRIKSSRYAGPLISTSILLAGVVVVLLGFSVDIYQSLIEGVLAGTMIGLLNTTYLATVQSIVPTELLARVLSIDSVGSFAAIPAGMAVGGILISAHGIVFDFTVAGIGLLLNGGVLMSFKEFRKFRYVPAS